MTLLGLTTSAIWLKELISNSSMSDLMKFQTVWEKESVRRNWGNQKWSTHHMVWNKVAIQQVRNDAVEEEIKILKLRRTEKRLRKFFRTSTSTNCSTPQKSKETRSLYKRAEKDSKLILKSNKPCTLRKDKISLHNHLNFLIKYTKELQMMKRCSVHLQIWITLPMLFQERTCPTPLIRIPKKGNINLIHPRNRQPHKARADNAESTLLVMRGVQVSMKEGLKLNFKANSISSCSCEAVWIVVIITYMTVTITFVISVDHLLRSLNRLELAVNSHN